MKKLVFFAAYLFVGVGIVLGGEFLFVYTMAGVINPTVPL